MAVSPEPTHGADGTVERAAFVAPLAAQVGSAAAEGMWRHWQLVMAAQAHTNLTGLRTAEAALHGHYLDALAALPHWPAEASLLDVGSGAGFPGLVLALARPHARVTLCEPRRKRAAFLRDCIAQLGLVHATVCDRRVETMPAERYACLTMRAVFAADEDLPKLRRVAAEEATLLVFRQGERAGCEAVDGWRLVGRTAYGHAPSGAVRRLERWTSSASIL